MLKSVRCLLLLLALVAGMATLVACSTPSGPSVGSTDSTVSPAPRTSPTPTEADLLRDYLVELKRAGRLDKEYRRVDKSLDKAWDANDTSTWPSSLKLWRTMMKLDEQYVVTYGAIDPPLSMKKAHAALLRAMKADVNIDFWIVEKVRLRVAYDQWWKEWENRYQKRMSDFREWRMSVWPRPVKWCTNLTAGPSS